MGGVGGAVLEGSSFPFEGRPFTISSSTQSDTSPATAATAVRVKTLKVAGVKRALSEVGGGAAGKRGDAVGDAEGAAGVASEGGVVGGSPLAKEGSASKVRRTEGGTAVCSLGSLGLPKVALSAASTGAVSNTR